MVSLPENQNGASNSYLLGNSTTMGLKESQITGIGVKHSLLT